MSFVYQTAIVSVVLLSACSRLDTYSSKFDAIAIGDSSSRAVQVMGNPDDEKSIEIPLIEAKQLIWKSIPSNKVYIVHIVMGKVVSKTKV